MIDVGTPVYVSGFYRGRGEVAHVHGERIRVRFDDGREHTVSARHVTPQRPFATTLHTLTRPSTTDAELVAVEKPETDRAPWYLAWIRKRGKCEWCSSTLAIQASHHPEEMGGSTSMKCSDMRTLPLCASCHGDFGQHQAIGSMTPVQTRQWASDRITRCLTAYIRETGK